MGGGVGGSLTRTASVLCLMFIGLTLGSNGGGGKGGEGDLLLPWDLILPERGVGGAGKLGTLYILPEGSVSCP